MLRRIAHVPQRHLVAVGSFLGKLLYTLDTRYRRIVRRNLRFAYPDWETRKVHAVCRGVYRNVATTMLETLQVAGLSREGILRRIRIHGEHHLLEAARNPGGAILISAHLGNWEMAHITGSCYLRHPLTLVARRIRPPFLNNWINHLRTRHGGEILDKEGAFRTLARTLRRGNMIGLLLDQGTVLTEAVEVRFFGKNTTATPAAALLARKFDSTVIPGFCVREDDGTLTVRVQAPLMLQKSADRRQDLLVNTQRMTTAIERMVRRYPDQWFWFHKRWKRHHPELYPEDLRHRRRQEMRKRKRAQTADSKTG